MAKTDKSTDVAVQTGGDVANYDGYAEFAGAGFENQTSDDYSVPFITILQGLSPQLEKDKTLRQGMFINTVTGEAFDGDDGIVFVPATTQHMVVEFKPRDSGGGFLGTHAVDSDIVNRARDQFGAFGDWKTPEGMELIETFYVYGLAIKDDGSYFQAVLGFTSSRIKKYKGWMTMAKTIQMQGTNGSRFVAPLMAHRYRLTSESEKAAKGSFYNWNIRFDGKDAMAARIDPKDSVFQEAVAIKKLIESGKAKPAHESKAADVEDATPSKPVF